MLSNRLPRDAVLIGKIGGGFGSLVAPFLVAFVLGLALLVPSAFPLFAGDIPARLAVLALASAVFVLIYYVIGTMISASSAKARTSLVAILLIWSGFQLVIPKLSDMLAALISPVRTETEVSLEKSLVNNTIETETAKELGRQYDLIFGSAKPGAVDDPKSPEHQKWDPLRDDIQMRARENKAQQIAAIEETYAQQKRRQQNLAVDLSLISPSAAFGRFVADICETGDLARTQYLEAVRSHQKALDNALFGKVKRTLMMHSGGRMSMSFQAEPVDPKNLPKFTVTPASLADTFKENWRSLLALAFWLIAPFVVAYSRFRNYDVR
jgi:ABC-type transport system involved in multi-copper enzyme maturation permease subunit